MRVEADRIHADAPPAGRVRQDDRVELPQVAVRALDDGAVGRAGDDAGGLAQHGVHRARSVNGPVGLLPVYMPVA